MRKENHNKLALTGESIIHSFFKTCQVVQESININYFLHLLALPIALARQVQWALDGLNYTWFDTPAHQALLNISTVLVKCLLQRSLQVFGRLGPFPQLLVCSLRAPDKCSPAISHRIFNGGRLNDASFRLFSFNCRAIAEELIQLKDV